MTKLKLIVKVTCYLNVHVSDTIWKYFPLNSCIFFLPSLFIKAFGTNICYSFIF